MMSWTKSDIVDLLIFLCLVFQLENPRYLREKQVPMTVVGIYIPLIFQKGKQTSCVIFNHWPGLIVLGFTGFDFIDCFELFPQ